MRKTSGKLVLAVVRRARRLRLHLSRRDLRSFSNHDLRECLLDKSDDPGGRLRRLELQCQGQLDFYLG